MDTEIVGAIKIKDGMFMGDEYSSQDLEFVIANKVTHVINTAAKTVPNHWEPIGVIYLCYRWEDNDSQIVLDTKDQISNETFQFIEDAYSKGESTLIHSIKGQSRSSTIIAAYLMRKYKWNLLKTLEFLNSRRPDLEIRANFIHQLSAYETRLTAMGIGPKTTKWTEVYDQSIEYENEELLLRNTYLNAQIGPLANLATAINKPILKPKLHFPEGPVISSVIPESIQPAKLKSEKTKKATNLMPVMKFSSTIPKSFNNSAQTRNNQIIKERSLGAKEESNKPTTYTYDALPIDKNSRTPEKQVDSRKYVDNVSAEGEYIYTANQPAKHKANQPNTLPKKAYLQPNSNEALHPNNEAADPTLKGLNKIYGIKEIPSFTNIINSSNVNNYFIQENSQVQVQAGANANIFVQGIDPSKVISTQKYDFNPEIPSNEKQPRSYSLQSKKEPVQVTEKKYKDELTHFITKKEDKKKPSPRNALIPKTNKSAPVQKYINQNTLQANDKILMQPYFVNPNAVGSFRTSGPIKATTSSTNGKKVDRPLSAAQKAAKPKHDKAGARPPTAPYRPSSPGLKGKVIAPTYTAPSFSNVKTYTVTTYNKIRGMSPGVKEKGSTLANVPTSDSKYSKHTGWKS